jgi:hypothetical protein
LSRKDCIYAETETQCTCEFETNVFCVSNCQSYQKKPSFSDKDPFLQNSWRRLAGKPEINLDLVDYRQLRRTEWSPRFDELCRNRLTQGAARYGLLNDPDKPAWNRIERIKLECELYAIDGNDERLVDIRNMAMLEFEEGLHPLKHFKASGEEGYKNEVIS